MNQCARCGGDAAEGEMCVPCSRDAARSGLSNNRLSEVIPMQNVKERSVKRDPIHQSIDADLSWLASVDWPAIGLPLHEAIDVERANKSTPDGYPTKVPGASEPTTLAVLPSGPCLEVDCPHERPCPDHDGALLTSVESAVAARPWHKDSFASDLRNAITYLGDARRAIASLEHRLDKLAPNVLGSHRLDQSNKPKCWAMARVGASEDVAHRVVIDGTTYALGSWAYGFHRKNDRLPTLEECRKRQSGKHVMVKAS